METAISIPNDSHQQAEAWAQKLRGSRDQFVVQALEQWIKAQRDEEITRQLNEVYKHEDSSLDPVLMPMQLTALEPEEW